jgi:phosphatidylglycerophosphate synthase
MSSVASEFTRMNKPREIEEFLDTYLIRPLGFVLVQLLRHTRITPNMVSMASALAGVGAATFYYHPDLRGALGGLAFFLLSSALDSADGQLARATGRKTQFGRLWDGICDNVAQTAIYFAIWLSYTHRGGEYSWLVFAIAGVAGLSHSTQCAATEYARTLFVYYCYGGREPENEQPEMLRAQLRQMQAAGRSPVFRVFTRLHLNYSMQQRGVLQSSDVLQRTFQAAVEQQPELRETFGRLYRAMNTRMVRLWALTGPNSHKIGIVAASFLPVLFEHGVLHDYGMLLYFGYDILVLNAVLLVLVRMQRRVDAEALATLQRSPARR